MSYLSELRARLSSLEESKKNKEAELEIQKNRRNGLYNIISGLSSTEFVASNISSEVMNICFELSDAFKWKEYANGLPEVIGNENEMTYDTDSNLGSAYSSLNAELSAVKTKIGQLEEEIRNLKSQISSTKSDISAEEDRLAEEARREEAARRAEEARRAAEAVKNALSSILGG